MEKLTLKETDYLGKLIVFEGTDGAGKTTMISKLVEFLSNKYGPANVLSIKQPTDMSRKTKLFQKMMYSNNHDDIDYRAVQLLTMSDRIQHIHEVIEPALKEGKFIICDRYVYTSYVNMLARGYNNETWFIDVAKYIIKPDVVFLAYVDSSLAIKRIKSRAEEKDRFLDEKLLINVSNNFIKLAEIENFKVLDTSREVKLSFDEVLKTLKEVGVINEI
jgi:dTMP kinase